MKPLTFNLRPDTPACPQGSFEEKKEKGSVLQFSINGFMASCGRFSFEGAPALTLPFALLLIPPVDELKSLFIREVLGSMIVQQADVMNLLHHLVIRKLLLDLLP